MIESKSKHQRLAERQRH